MLVDAESLNEKEYSAYEFIRFTWCDTNGVARAKYVPKASVKDVIRAGGTGTCSLTVVFDAAESQPASFPKLMSIGTPDYLTVPVVETLRACPWSGSSSNSRVGEFLCMVHEKCEGYPVSKYDSRWVCLNLLEKLKEEFGLDLYSALEYEFGLSKDGVPVTDGTHIYSTVVFKQTDRFQFTVSKRLATAGIKTQTLQCEFGSGQCEIVLEPKFGIEAADDAFR